MKTELWEKLSAYIDRVFESAEPAFFADLEEPAEADLRFDVLADAADSFETDHSVCDALPSPPPKPAAEREKAPSPRKRKASDIRCSIVGIAAPKAVEPLFDPDSGRIVTDESFGGALLRLIGEKGMTDPQCYNRAFVSRSVFNKIKQSALNPEKSGYRPSKQTALALAVALELSLDETNDLLEKAGMTLSHSVKGDVIVEYFLRNGIHDLFEINEALFKFDQPMLGSF